MWLSCIYVSLSVIILYLIYIIRFHPAVIVYHAVWSSCFHRSDLCSSCVCYVMWPSCFHYVAWLSCFCLVELLSQCDPPAIVNPATDHVCRHMALSLTPAWLEDAEPIKNHSEHVFINDNGNDGSSLQGDPGWRCRRGENFSLLLHPRWRLHLPWKPHHNGGRGKLHTFCVYG